MNKKEKILSKLKIFERARNQIESTIFECDSEIASSEEIEVALEYLVVAIPQLKKYWDENLKESDL